MATRAIIGNNENNQQIEYTFIDSIEDIGQVFCYGPDEDLIALFNEGKKIMVNTMGGYCFFEENYHHVTSWII